MYKPAIVNYRLLHSVLILGAADVISKFKGDGLSFKAKFYGTAAVKEARGMLPNLSGKGHKLLSIY